MAIFRFDLNEEYSKKLEEATVDKCMSIQNGDLIGKEFTIPMFLQTRNGHRSTEEMPAC